MPLSRYSKKEKKVLAALRSRFRLKQRFEAIDHDEDVIIPIMEALKAGKPVMGLPSDQEFDLELVNDQLVIGEAPDTDHSTGSE